MPLTPFLSRCRCLQLPHFRRTNQRHNLLFLSSPKDASHRLPLILKLLLLSLFPRAPNGLFSSPFLLSIISGYPSHRRPQTALVAGYGPPSSPFSTAQKRCLSASGRNGTAFCTDGRYSPPKSKSHPVRGEPPAPFGLSVAWLSTNTSGLDLLFLRRENIGRGPLARRASQNAAYGSAPTSASAASLSGSHVTDTSDHSCYFRWPAASSPVVSVLGTGILRSGSSPC